MHTTVDETPADELTLRSVEERIIQATEPILRRVEEIWALLASRTEMESAGHSEASGSMRNHESISPSRNRYDSVNNVLKQQGKFATKKTIFLSLSPPRELQIDDFGP